MGVRKFIIVMHDDDYKQLHDSMNLVIKREDGLILERIFEGGTRQAWYRTVISKGLKSLILEFEEKAKQYESKPGNG